VRDRFGEPQPVHEFGAPGIGPALRADGGLGDMGARVDGPHRSQAERSGRQRLEDVVLPACVRDRRKGVQGEVRRRGVPSTGSGDESAHQINVRVALIEGARTSGLAEPRACEHLDGEQVERRQNFGLVQDQLQRRRLPGRSTLLGGTAAPRGPATTLRTHPSSQSQGRALRPGVSAGAGQRSDGPAVAEDMEADDVDLASGIAEERSQAKQDPGVGVLACSAGLVPVGVRDNEEQVLGIRSDVRLPEVLEVVVVRRGATALDLGDDAAARSEAVDEIRPCVGDEAVAGGEYDFLAETEVFPQEAGDDRLDCAALSAVDVDEVDLTGVGLQVRRELGCEGIDALEFSGFSGSQRASREPLMPDLHGRSFTAAATRS